ncbi:MAG: hypothetical protein JRF57_05535 [Deltaproteobacteria bacterium]|nr:hypothetical protein [Deltaproteobacteria bacterium]
MSPKNPTKNTRFNPPRPVGGYPRESIKKMAVLFTDIVGSSNFFRSHGDIAGRKMLKKHQDLASPPIIEHGGIVVKMLGDAVMAYFLNAAEALKAAIKIQERFRNHNRGKAPGDQIHIRLGVHFGEGIVEERDIFGDVVNMAAKFLPLVKGDQIVISLQVWDQVRALPSVRLEPFPIPADTALPEGFTLFKVLWDEGVDFDPLIKTLVYLRPLFNLGKENFLKTWSGFLSGKNHLWGDQVETELTLPDKSVALIVRKAAFSLTLAKRVFEFLKINLGRDAAPFVPIQILIDAGSYLRGGNLVLDDLAVNWKEFEPGEVYISGRAHAHIKHTANISIRPAPDPNQPRSFVKISVGDAGDGDPPLFRYQGALIQGEYSPCYYCGDRRHQTTHCPSKGLTEITQALSRLGYRPVEEINRLFFNLLNGKLPDPAQLSKLSTEATDPTLLAFQGFYELKLVYQLRFFLALWGTSEENWNRIKERPFARDEQDRSGLLWIGQDCIRVSNLEQAQSILLDCLNRDAQDYRVYGALAFLYIEKGDYPQAKYYLKKALQRTRTTPQRIFIHFLLSRLYDLSEDQARAEEMVRKILYLNPYCYEAIYQDIIFRFRKGKEAVALHQLVKLIRRNREFYLYALIDPELAAHSDAIQPRLKELLEEAKSKAESARETGKEALDRIVQWLDEEDKEVVEARSRWQKIEELSRVNSYFGHLDIIHYAESIVTMSRRSIESRKRQLAMSLRELDDRAEKALAWANRFRYEFLIKEVKQELLRIRGMIDSEWEGENPKVAGKFKESLNKVKAIAARLDEVESRLERLGTIHTLLFFIAAFFKKSLVFQSANLALALILFPILAYYLNFMIPVFQITSHNIWSYQKAVLALGGVSGLLLAVISAARGLHKT